MAREKGCQAIAVGHHQNDQAETILLNLKRGAGLRGLAGMRPKSANPMAPDSVPIVLCYARHAIILNITCATNGT